MHALIPAWRWGWGGVGGAQAGGFTQSDPLSEHGMGETELGVDCSSRTHGFPRAPLTRLSDPPRKVGSGGVQHS